MPDIWDRQRAFSGTQAIAPAQNFAADKLEAYLAERIPGFRGPISIAQFKGGQSNPTFRLDTPAGAYVLRRKPAGKLLPSAHAVEREHRVIAALEPLGFPVPKPYLLCLDESIIGTAFYVMAHVEGRIFWEPRAPGLTALERARLFDDLNATLARLHSAPMTGLEDFGKPQGYVARQIRRWSEQYRASATDEIAAMDRLIAWLPGACPSQAGAAIVHGDFRLDNCIIHEREPVIVAVLDWELATLGDPIADFAYHLMAWFMPVAQDGSGIGSLKGHERDPGVPSFEDYVARYCLRTGRDRLPGLDIYLAYNFFRLAAILQGIAGRVRDGTAANAQAARMGAQVRPLAETAWAFAKAAGA